MSKIGTNQMAVNAQKAQQQIQRQMTKIMEKLSTGQRINKPNDDPAGLSISTKMTAQIREVFKQSLKTSMMQLQWFKQLMVH